MVFKEVHISWYINTPFHKSYRFMEKALVLDEDDMDTNAPCLMVNVIRLIIMLSGRKGLNGGIQIRVLALY